MNTQLRELKKLLPGAREQEPLARYTTFKIGGPADLFYEAKTTTELEPAIIYARKLNVPLFILGGGTNVLIGDRGIRGFVIKNNTSAISIRAMKGHMQSGESRGVAYVEADSGVPINKLVRFTVEEGLAGLEMHLGLPGSVGGAIFMNSKWMHPVGYVGDVVYQVAIVTPTGQSLVVPKSYFQFAYDHSILQKTDDSVLSVVFALHQKNKEELWNIANDSIRYRKATQPQGIQSAGCTFRNIPKSVAMTIPTPNHTTSAGFLVDHAGLKGVSVGDAQISDVHANFIMNRGKATASDVVQLIELARARVKAQFGVDLQEEIVRIGEF